MAWNIQVDERKGFGIIVKFLLDDDVKGSILIDDLDDLKGLPNEIIKVNPRISNQAGSDRIIAN